MSEIPTLHSIAAGMALADVMAVVVTTASKKYLIKTASEGSLKAVVSAGEEKENRKGNVIYAQHVTQDIIKGYDVTLKTVLMHPELHALIDGGTVTTAAEGGAFESYSGPVMGAETQRTPFTLDIYMGNLDTGGNPIDYLQVTLTGCRGKPCDWTVKDGEFWTPEYTIQSRPAFGVSPMSVTKAQALPTAASM